MKITKNTNILFFGLTLLLSLVSFSDFSNLWPVETTKTTLVIKDTTQDLSRSILFNAINKGAVAFDNRFSKHSFTRLLTIQNLHDLSYFKTRNIHSSFMQHENKQTTPIKNKTEGLRTYPQILDHSHILASTKHLTKSFGCFALSNFQYTRI